MDQKDIKNRKRFPEIDFIRAICAIGIVIFHFSVHSASDCNFLEHHANGTWGSILITVFFIVSGFSIYHNNQKIDSIKDFYFRRWKSIFPMYYICFILFFAIEIIKQRKVFYGPSPVSLLLTAFGLDGYFLYRMPNYYQMGEWFIGALVIVYLMYPLVLVIRNKLNSIIILVVLFALEIVTFASDILVVDDLRSIIACLFSFYVGMVIKEYDEILLIKMKNMNMVIAVVGFLLLAFISIDVDYPFVISIVNQVQGYLLFIVLFYVGSLTGEKLGRAFKWLASVSYPLFLVHHKIICFVLDRYNPTGFIRPLFILMGILIVSLIGAWLISYANKKIQGIKVWKKS